MPISEDGRGDAFGFSESAPEVEGYRITGRLGAGGMGTVWRAAQLSTRREVALKLLGVGRFGSDRGRARFEREVELAARLEHPNIARVYDSGLHQGVYYYAMELIDGSALDDYVQENDLQQRQVLQLMQTAAEAIQHAHQRGVIHRDLKPSNILVTEDGQPHVLDFGLGKGFLDEDHSLTISLDGEVAGTPAYMSPEQAAGQPVQVDTRSDVYSLGVILFRLLTGQSPHDLSGTRYEVLHRIAAEETRRPRQVTGKVDKELEALLLKALAHEPERRYASAGELARDIGNYLAGEPLAAKVPTTAYFLRKRLRKYRVPVGIGATIVAIVLVLIAFSYIQVARERSLAVAAKKEADRERSLAVAAKKEADRERSLAVAAKKETDREVTKLEATKGFLTDILVAGQPERLGRDLSVLGLLAWAETEIPRRFAGQPELEAETRNAIGRAYLSFGHYAAAYEQLQRSADIYRETLGAEHPATVTALQGVAACWNGLGKYRKAIRLDRQILQIQERDFGRDHIDTLKAMCQLAVSLDNQGKYDEAEQLRKQSAETALRTLGEKHSFTLQATRGVAISLVHRGWYADAAEVLRDLLKTQREVLDNWHPDVLRTVNSLAECLNFDGEYAQAAAVAGEAREATQRVFGEESPEALSAVHNLAYAACGLDDHERAENLERQVLEIQQKTLGEKHPNTLETTRHLAVFLDQQGKSDEAEKLFREVMEARKLVLGEKHPHTLSSKNEFGVCLLRHKRYREAEGLLDTALETQRQTLGGEHPITLITHHNLAICLQLQGRYAEAKDMLEIILEARLRVLGEEHHNTLRTIGAMSVLESAQLAEAGSVYSRFNVALQLAEKGKSANADNMFSSINRDERRIFGDDVDIIEMATSDRLHLATRSEALDLRRRVLAFQERTPGKEHPRTLTTIHKLADLLAETGRYDDAEALFRKALDGRRRILGENAPETLETLRSLDECVKRQERAD